MRSPSGSALAASILVLIVFAACTFGSDPETSTPSPIPQGGVLRIGVIDTDQCPLTMCGGSWDPQISYNNLGFELGRCCLLRTLLSYQEDPNAANRNQLQPDLAAELPTIEPDGATWTFHLRPNLYYSPPLASTPVTSQDFVRSIERALSPRPVNLTDGWGPFVDTYLGDFLDLQGILQGAREYVHGSADRISGLETPDPSTLVIRLTRPTGTLGYLLAFPDLAPIPPDPADPTAKFGIATDLPRLYGRFAAATGPYMVEGADSIDYGVPPEDRALPSGDDGSTYTLVPNPSWSRANDPLRPAPSERIVISRVDDDADAIRLVSEGGLDAVWDWAPPPEVIATARESSGVQLRETSVDAVRYLGLNVAVRPLDDVHVRRAIAYAVDRPVAAALYAEQGNSGDVATHVGLDDEEGNLLLNYDGFGVRTGPNLEAARREMAGSRYDSDGDGRCDDSACSAIPLLAPRVTFAGDTSWGRVARSISQDLAPLGLDVDPQIVPPGRFYPLYGKPESRVAMRVDGWFKDSATGATWFPPLFGSSRLGVTSIGNDYSVGAAPRELREWGYDVERVPSVDDRIRACLDEAFGAQLQCWAEFDRYATEEVVSFVPLVAEKRTVILSDRIERVAFDQAASPPILALDQLVVPAGAPPSASPGVVPDGAPSPTIPNGSYQATITVADLRAAGAPTENPDDVADSTGTFTLVLQDGVWYQTQFAEHPFGAPLTFAGSYRTKGQTVTFRALASRSYADVLPALAWRTEGDALVFRMNGCELEDKIFCAFIRAQFTSHPWERIG